MLSVGRSLLRRAGLQNLAAQAVYTKYLPQAAGTSLRGFSTSQDDMHDDFKPKFKSEATTSVTEQIEQDIKSHKVFIYMKGNPDAPMCGFSNMACRILDAYEVPYGSRNVLADAELREGVKKYSSWPTIPQVYVDGEFVGGSDILMGMHQSGDLKKLFGGQ